MCNKCKAAGDVASLSAVQPPIFRSQVPARYSILYPRLGRQPNDGLPLQGDRTRAFGPHCTI